MNDQLPGPVQALQTYEVDFNAQNAYDLSFTREIHFASQLLTKNEFTMKIASQHPQSLRNAMLNVSALGISLNPAENLAYLVPRSPAQGQQAQICLDISWRGLKQLATESGAIVNAVAVLVYASDEFDYYGPRKAPYHKANVRDPSRCDANDPWKNLDGGYCIADIPGGGVCCEWMPADEINKVKSTSKAQNGPWKNWAGEMIKKTIIKRAAKNWPQVGGRGRLDEAIAVLNEHEGLTDEHMGGEKDITPRGEAELPMYEDTVFADNLAKWTALVFEKNMNPAAIVAKVSTKYALTDTQTEQILNIGADQ